MIGRGGLSEALDGVRGSEGQGRVVEGLTGTCSEGLAVKRGLVRGYCVSGLASSWPLQPALQDP